MLFHPHFLFWLHFEHEGERTTYVHTRTDSAEAEGGDGNFLESCATKVMEIVCSEATTGRASIVCSEREAGNQSLILSCVGSPQIVFAFLWRDMYYSRTKVGGKLEWKQFVFKGANIASELPF